MSPPRRPNPQFAAVCPPPAAGVLSLVLALGCGGSRTSGTQPEASVASSMAAQGQFRSIEEQWTAIDPHAREPLETQLTAFVQRFPTQRPARRIRIYLAWLNLERGRVADAERWLDLADTGLPGSAADLLAVLRAAIALQRGQAEPAYHSLLALRGRLVVADDRLLCLDRLIAAALAAGHYAAAVEHVLALAAESARRHRDRVWRDLAARLETVPLSVLEQSLRTLTGTSIASAPVRRSERVAAVNWVRRQIRSILSRSAIDQRDVGLAQRLVAETSRGADDRENAELLRLATEGNVAPRVRGRRLGLALPTDDGRRQRAQEVAAGIHLVLEQLAADPPIQLVTWPVGSESGGLSDSLSRLAGAGAALLVAGVDVAGAREATDFARRLGVPTLLLHDPALPAGALPDRAYVLGASEHAANAPLVHFLSSRHARIALVGSPEAPCPELGAREGRGWELPSPAALAFLASADCARNVLMALTPGQSAFVGVGLDALPLLGDDLRSHAVWATSAASVPLFEGLASNPALERFRRRKGRLPGWYEALGHDVAVVAGRVLPAAIGAGLETAAAVHERIAQGLAGVRLEGLWTSEASALSPERSLPRSFSAVRVPAPEAP